MSKFWKRGLAWGAAALAAAGQAWAVTLHVAPDGDDAADGSRRRPLATLAGARDRVRQARAADAEGPVEVLFADGAYALAEPVVFGPEDSGRASAPVRYAAAPGAKPVFSGGKRLPPFQAGPDGVWRARVEPPFRFEQLYVNGRRATRARSPNRFWYSMLAPAQYGIDPLTGAAADLSRRAFLAAPADIAPLAGKSRDELSNVVVRVFHSWEASQARVQAVEPGAESARVVVTPSTPWAFFNWGHYLPRYQLENFREALDEAGEWFLDEATGELSYLPLPGERIEKTVAVAPVAPAFLHVRGDARTDRWVSHLTFEGLTFEHAAWTLPAGGQGDGQAAVTQPAAVELDGARRVAFRDCVFAHTGAHGVWFRKGCRDSALEHCHVYDVGGGAVRVGDMKWSADELPDRLTGSITLDNNILQQGGRVFPGATGVWIGHASDVRVTHNDIGDFYYTGISMGWTWGYRETATHRNTLAFNHIHDIGRGVLSDMGGIYTLGLSEGTAISNNHIHDVYSYDYSGRGGWGLYTDEGSARMVFENNLVHHVKTGCIHQHYGKENVFRNNILAFSMDGQIQRSRIEEHTTVIVTNNIIYWDNDSAAFWRGHAGAYGSVTDVVLNANTYWNPNGIASNAFNGGSWEAWREAGQDAQSRIADPRFKNPAKRDFRLDPRSPAVEAGFKPFDASEAGVYGSQAWRRLAAQNVCPPVEFAPTPDVYAVRKLNENFENLPLGAPFPNVTAYVENKGDSIRVTDEAAFSGKQSLKIQDAEGLTHGYNPHFTFSCAFTNTTLENRFAVRTTAGAEFFTEWRDYPEGGGNGYAVGPCLVFRGGKIFARTREGERVVADLPADTWAQVRVAAAVGSSSQGSWSVSVARAGQPDVKVTALPFANPAFRSMEWLGFCSTATNTSAYYLDDFFFGDTPPQMRWADETRVGRPYSKDPSVVRFGDRYLMYFSLPPFDARHAPTNAPKGWSIGIAESRDLLDWKKIAELWPEQDCDQKGLCAPGALVLDGKVHLFYQSYGNGPRDAICHAVSPDGVTFTRDPRNPVFRPHGDWTSGRAIDAEAFPFNGKLLLYFATRDPSMTTQMVGVASADLASDFGPDAWTQMKDGPVLRPELPWEKKCIEAPSVIRRGDRLFMFYAGGYNNEPQQVGVAQSADGLTWTRVSDAPLLANGQPGDWNASESGHPGIFGDADGATWLFFQGNPDKGKTWLLSKTGIQWENGRPAITK